MLPEEVIVSILWLYFKQNFMTSELPGLEVCFNSTYIFLNAFYITAARYYG